jgi:drug/metabolite transporter (DMT)-like permease
MQLPWYVTALGAALVWGIHYPLVDHALKRLSLTSVLLLTALPILILPLVTRGVGADLAALRAMSWSERAPILALALTSLAGSVLLYLSIAGKNATLASLIEITYPVFVALFAFLLFRQMHLNTAVLIGAGLVFTGVAVIILGNP